MSRRRFGIVNRIPVGTHRDASVVLPQDGVMGTRTRGYLLDAQNRPRKRQTDYLITVMMRWALANRVPVGTHRDASAARRRAHGFPDGEGRFDGRAARDPSGFVWVNGWPDYGLALRTLHEASLQG